MMEIKISFEDWITKPFPNNQDCKYIITNCPEEYVHLFEKAGISFELENKKTK